MVRMTTTKNTPATVPTVFVRKVGTEHRVVIMRGADHTIVRVPVVGLTGGAAERLAASIRGALADAYLAGQADGVRAMKVLS